MTTFWRQLRIDHRGQDISEYARMPAFLARVSAALFSSAGGNINLIWPSPNSELRTAAGGKGRRCQTAV